MPFRLINARTTFQRVMVVILLKFMWKYALVYLKDVVVFLKATKNTSNIQDQYYVFLKTVVSH